MFSKIVLVSCVLAVASAGLLPAAQYAPAAAVSSQSIIRHEQPHGIAPLAYHSAPVAYAAPAHYATQTVLRNNHGSLLAAAPAITLARSAPYLSAAPTLALARSTPYLSAAPALAHSAPLLHAAPQEIDTHPAYEFSYSVADGHTGDKKEQHEVRDGDAVQGSYSLLEADGSIRTVHYSADDHSGFNAVVSHSAPAAHPAPAPIAVAHAPILAHH